MRSVTNWFAAVGESAICDRRLVEIGLVDKAYILCGITSMAVIGILRREFQLFFEKSRRIRGTGRSPHRFLQLGWARTSYARSLRRDWRLVEWVSLRDCTKGLTTPEEELLAPKLSLGL